MKSKSQLKREAVQKGDDWHYCHKCQTERGGIFEKGKCVTVTKGTCSRCGKTRTLVPNIDYDWPEEGKKAWFD